MAQRQQNINNPQIEITDNETINRPSLSTNNDLLIKASSLSLPQVKFLNKLKPSCQSTISLR